MKDIFENYKRQLENMCLDLKDKKTLKKQIPNLLTMSRLLAPFCIIPCAFVGNYPLCLSFIAMFSFTDLLDGYIARKYNLTSELGRDLDAIADKIFGLTLLISLVSKNPLYILTLLLESGIASINIVRKFENKNPKSDIIGKIKMTILYVTIAFGYGSIYLNIPINLINTSLAVTSGLQLLTAGVYISQDKNETKENNNINENNKLLAETKDENKKSENITAQINYYKNLKETLINDNNLNYSKEDVKIKKYTK